MFILTALRFNVSIFPFFPTVPTIPSHYLGFFHVTPSLSCFSLPPQIIVAVAAGRSQLSLVN